MTILPDSRLLLALGLLMTASPVLAQANASACSTGEGSYAASPVPLAELVDPRRAAEAVAGLSHPSGDRRPSALLHLMYPPGGKDPVVTLLLRGGVRADSAALRNALADAVQPRETQDTARFHVVVGPGPTPELNVADALHECFPTVVNQQVFRRQITAAIGEHQRRIARAREDSEEGWGPRIDPRRLRSVHYRMRIDEDGAVESLRRDRSSGDNGLDRDLDRIMRGLRFVPASIGGLPIAVWVELPVGIEQSSPRPGTRR
jgi:TonB family protein